MGKVLLVTSLAVTAIVTIASKELGWANYWGGFVDAPFALLIAALFAIAMIKRRDLGEGQSRCGKRS